MREPYKSLRDELFNAIRSSEYGEVEKIFVRQDMVNEMLDFGHASPGETIQFFMYDIGAFEIVCSEPGSSCVYVVEYTTGIKLQRFGDYTTASTCDIESQNEDRELDNDIEVPSEELKAILSGGM